MARFADRKLVFLRRLRPFAEGTPAHDHLDDILASLDQTAFQRCFVPWAASLTGASVDAVVQNAIASTAEQASGHDVRMRVGLAC